MAYEVEHQFYTNVEGEESTLVKEVHNAASLEKAHFIERVMRASRPGEVIIREVQ